jgi:hypothetical protein
MFSPQIQICLTVYFLDLHYTITLTSLKGKIKNRPFLLLAVFLTMRQNPGKDGHYEISGFKHIVPEEW